MKLLNCRKILGLNSRFVFLEKPNEAPPKSPASAVDEHKKYVEKALALKNPDAKTKEKIKEIKALEEDNTNMNRVQAELLAKELLNSNEDGPETIKQRKILLKVAEKKFADAIKQGGYEKVVVDYMRHFYRLAVGQDPVRQTIMEGVEIKSGRRKIKFEDGGILSFHRGVKAAMKDRWKKIG